MTLHQWILTDVRKFHSVLNEKNWDVVSYNVPIALFGIELDGKPSDVANSVCGATAAQDR